ncbi:Uma2 family endonuclease [Plectonema radiosum NIES-515]|uniref:Uma2 family endonuclease n=1 Tax=Plectonema radiosum NIES-515 TaxID=2986073 RepID=A0ABT3B152_9CYAN|nr:Uma2 family endonuclease [Plectonema radiosum]MCV3215091.1 Uma2 family endonuclease [Plectonema radiosum NIES-515]
MVQQLTPDTAEVIYPESDGQPMADNTEQFQWIVKIKENLEILFALQDNVFIAGNLLWYAVQGDVKLRQAPDAMVVFGRPKGKRGSYKQWEEDNIPPQVVFEILSPGNKTKDMANKLLFYQRHGVEEYYIYDPQTNELTGLLRSQENLEVIEEINNWVSPRLEVRFELTRNTLEIYRPDGQRFLTSVELNQIREQEYQRAEQEYQRAEQERQRAEQERQRAEQEYQRAEQECQEKEAAQLQLELERQRYQDLLAQLQERGIDL